MQTASNLRLVLMCFVDIVSRLNSSLHGLQTVLVALNRFMFQLEHMAVLLALCNTRLSRSNGVPWRKQIYGKVITLLSNIDSKGTSFNRDLDAVCVNMWQLPNVTRGGEEYALGHGSALQFLDSMGLYVDKTPDHAREARASRVQLQRETANLEERLQQDLAAVQSHLQQQVEAIAQRDEQPLQREVQIQAARLEASQRQNEIQLSAQEGRAKLQQQEEDSQRGEGEALYTGPVILNS